ncbi:PiT family inorganic phosphate transporter [Primorskyibacter sedentarius]|uniref:Phosphate transporter n=1 Tax=Primorskyibacter sedentarius TaxID=745311 RepID=A0A4R3J3K2_9RHOB|nr:inorganic phosphate transporter [Primorskyibacter sedentarius]TCS59887.1 PiT family inorganic phosphate transporter [Primorskyibacter sedentarius]
MHFVDMGHIGLPIGCDERRRNHASIQGDRAVLRTENLEDAVQRNRDELFRFGTALIFIVGIMLFTIVRTDGGTDGILMVAAAMIGGYMAMNIGANDVANNVGPAVGSHAITLTGAIFIAAFFEAGGALIAGGDVVGTIKSGIINPDLVTDRDTFVWLMIAALLAAAVWLNVATVVGAPVSTTHSIVGGVLGAGIAAEGWGIADWSVVGQIAASWVISPVMGGLIAAGFLYIIKRKITYRRDVLAAANRVVPVLVAVMAWAFATYLMLKGIKKIVAVSFPVALLIGLVVAAVVFVLMRPYIARLTGQLENHKASVNDLFTVPLIFAAALLSFAHGANDVANAVGPLAGINEAITEGGISTKAGIPIWVMAVGAMGISLGLALYGPKLIRTVGSEITELDKMRAFCIAMAAAITVIIASQLGLPVSSTHIAVGGVFGVGFLREYIKSSYARMVDDIRDHHADDDSEAVETFLTQFESADVALKGEMLRNMKAQAANDRVLGKKERRGLGRVHRVELVKRNLLLRIAAAWIITVPIAAMLAAIFFFMIRGMLLP